MALAEYKIQLLDEFEKRTDEWKSPEFETRLIEINPKAYYKDAQGIISEAHSLERWPKTVKKYVISNYISWGSSSQTRILNEILLKLPFEEQEEIVTKVNYHNKEAREEALDNFYKRHNRKRP